MIWHGIVVTMALTREQLPKDPETLTTFALGQALELEKLRFEIAVLKRQQYGRSSEQADRELLQMHLRLEDLPEHLPRE
jgi:hypothetical protein